MRKPKVKSGRGGARKGAGRKPNEEKGMEKKINLNLMVEPSLVEGAGGKEEARRVAYQSIKRKAKNK